MQNASRRTGPVLIATVFFFLIEQNARLVTKLFHNIYDYYMPLSHKDWELPNSWIWLAETDIDRGLDFPI